MNINDKAITGVFYVSPYGTLPPGVTVAGVRVQADVSQIPPTIKNPILVIRLRLTTTPHVIGVSATSGPGVHDSYAIYQPPFPLSTMEPYMVDVIWVEEGTDPVNIDWNSAVASSPVTAAKAYLSEASVDANKVVAQVSYGSSGIGLGAQVNAYALSKGTYVLVGSGVAEGNAVTLDIDNPGYPDAYYLGVQAVTPVNNLGGAGNFAKPFSFGPPGALEGVPQAASSVNKVVYDRRSLKLSWDLGVVEDCVAPDSSVVDVLASGEVVASFEGGPTSANFAVDIFAQPKTSVQIRTVSNQISHGAVVGKLITDVPKVTDVQFDATSKKVTASVGIPVLADSVNASLIDGDVLVAGPVTEEKGIVSFDYDAGGRVGLTVVAGGTASKGTVIGPLSGGASLLATEPDWVGVEIRTDPKDTASWQLDCEWLRLPDDGRSVSGYTVTVLENGKPIQSVTGTATHQTLSIAKKAVDLKGSHTIALIAHGNTGGISPMSILPIPFQPPALEKVVTTASQIEAQWIAPVGLPDPNTLPVSYQIVIAGADGTKIYRSEKTSALNGAVSLLDLPLSDAADPVLWVDVSLGLVTLRTDGSMGAKSSATPLMVSPSVAAVTVDPLTNKTTLNWGAVKEVSSYTIDYTQGDPTSGIKTNSHTLKDVLTAGANLGFTVKCVGASNTVPVTGPPSDLAWVPTNMTNIVAARFNNGSVSVSWAQVSDAKSYQVNVYDNAATPVNVYAGTSTETSLDFAFTVDTSKQYTAYVQAVSTSGEGLCGKSVGLFEPGFFLSKELASTSVPYVYPATEMSSLGTSGASPPAKALSLYLPELGSAKGALGTTPIIKGPFTIEPSGDSGLPYKLTIAADPKVWTFDTMEIRTALQTDYTDFMKLVETPPAGGEGVTGASPYGISLVQAAIGRYLPQTFAEQLYYNFGFSTVSSVGAGYVDLRPGMVLRVVISDYIDVPDFEPLSWIEGYAGATVMDFEIGSYQLGGDWKVGFDGFLSALFAKGALKVDPPAKGTSSVQAGVAAASDLYYPAFAQPFYRLFIPPKVVNPSGQGSNATSSNFTLAGASDYASLQTVGVDPADDATAYFRGRSTVEVMIKISLNGNDRLVPVGTSLGDILNQVGSCPFATSNASTSLRVHRALGPVITNVKTEDSLNSQMEVRCDWGGFPVYSDGNGLDAMSMPLLSGDQVFTNKLPNS